MAKFHALELAPFIGLLWIGLHYFGLVGAAWAWALRVAFDAGLLFMAGGKIPRWQRLIPGGLIVLMAASVSPTSILSARTVLELFFLALSILWSWNLSPALRTAVRGRRGIVRPRTAV